MVSSCYPVFAGKNPQLGVKILTESFDLKVAHHFNSEFMEYYVLVDANGNHMDLMPKKPISSTMLWRIRSM